MNPVDPKISKSVPAMQIHDKAVGDLKVRTASVALDSIDESLDQTEPSQEQIARLLGKFKNGHPGLLVDGFPGVAKLPQEGVPHKNGFPKGKNGHPLNESGTVQNGRPPVHDASA